MNERTTQREVTDLATTARIDRQAVPVLVYNVSAGGCMFEADREHLAAGNTVSLQLGGDSHLAEIVWSFGRFAGAKFVSQLDRTLVTGLGFAPALHGPTAFMIPCDRFGRSLPRLISRG